MSKEAPKSVMVVGSGGREHALMWKLEQSPEVGELYCAPGNAGTEQLGKNVPIGVEEIDRLAQFASDNKIGMTVVGPEAALEKGIVNQFRKDNLTIFGPTQEAARIETSKAWADGFYVRQNIHHANSVIFNKIYDALNFVSLAPPEKIVIKADGLCAGKGVVLPDTHDEATQTIVDMMLGNKYGEAGETILIQERLKGREASVIALSDGNVSLLLSPAVDHKSLYEHGGPNTGGMGAYSPDPLMTPEMLLEIQKTIIAPGIAGMREEGYPFMGAWYVGLMIIDNRPKVLETNARFGDPETQVQLMRMKSDLFPLLRSSSDGTLHKQHVEFKPGAALCVVFASEGYPGEYQTGYEIYGLDTIKDPDVHVFHAGTKRENGVLKTSGGRVLGITAYGKDIPTAREKTYSPIGEQGVHFRGMYYLRGGIGRGIK